MAVIITIYRVSSCLFKLHCWVPVMADNATASWENSTDTWREVRFVGLAIVIPVGLVFNTIAFLVFATSWLRHSVPGRYFMALAVADTMVLLGELLIWLNTKHSLYFRLGITFLHTSDVACKWIYVFRYAARIWSSWVTVAITIERFLTVTFPLRILSNSNPKTPLIVVWCLGLISLILASFPLMTLSAGYHRNTPLCSVAKDQYGAFTLCILLIIGVGGELLPISIVFVFTTLIIRALTRARQHRACATEGQPLTSSRKGEAQPTTALVSIATAFVITRLPYVATFFLINHSHHLSISATSRYYIYIAYCISYILGTSNYAINFLLFCVTGSTFRAELRRCLHCRPGGKTWRGTTKLPTPLNRGTTNRTKECYTFNISFEWINGIAWPRVTH